MAPRTEGLVIMGSIFDWFREDPGRTIVAGAAGGVIRWVALRESWKDGLTSIIVGAICAVYLGPLVEPVLEPLIGKLVIDEGSRSGFSGFVVGLMGIGLAGFVIDVSKAFYKRFFKDDPNQPGKE